MTTKYQPDGDGVGQGGTPTSETTTPTAPATGAPTQPETYTRAQVEGLMNRAVEQRDGAWNKHVSNPETLRTIAQSLGLTIQEAKQVVQNAADADPDDPVSELKKQIAELRSERDQEKNTQKETVAQKNFDTTVTRLAQTQPYGKDPITSDFFEACLRGFFYSDRAKSMSPQEAAANIQANMVDVFKKLEDAKTASAAAGRRQPLSGSSSAGGATKVPTNLTKDADVEKVMTEILRQTGGLRFA